MRPGSFVRWAGAAALVMGLAPSVNAEPATVAGVTFDTDNSVKAATATTEGTNTFNFFNAPLAGVGVSPAIDPDHHIGTLLGSSPSFAVDITAGASGAGGRTIIEMTWDPGVAAINGTGDDLYVFESGTANSPTQGFPELFAVAVRIEGESTFSDYRYEHFDEGDVAASKLVTGYDFSDFGVPADGRVDAVRIISMHNASATTPPNLEDRVDGADGQGNVLLDAGSGTGNAIVQGANSGNAGQPYPDSAMDADIVYVVATQTAGPAATESWELYH